MSRGYRLAGMRASDPSPDDPSPPRSIRAVSGPFSGLTGLGAGRLANGQLRIVVVGASGWLGMATLDLLYNLLGAEFGTRVAAFGSQARTLTLCGGLEVRQRSLDTLKDLQPAPTIVLHFAFLTQEKLLAMSQDDYVATNRQISGAVLDALDTIGAEAVFVPSSGAVYIVGEDSVARRKGQYGDMKRDDEERFSRWAIERGRRAVIARVFNLSGPYINKQSDYALACFIADVLADRPISISADRPVYRSYVAISELMSVVFALLTEPETGTVLFDTAGDQILEMADVAAIVQSVLGGDRGILRPELSGGEPNLYVGDGGLYAALRGSQHVKPVAFPQQVLETARYMFETSNMPGKVLTKNAFGEGK